MVSRKVIAIASAGGHWKELMLLEPVFEKFNVSFITTMDGLNDGGETQNTFVVKDSNQNEKLSVVISFIQILKLIYSIKPDCIISTGASPGALAMMIGRLYGCKTIWVDSIANSEELTLGGKIASYFADVTLTQWEHLADNKSVFYKGSLF